jgi:hypothetical protein
MRVEVRSACVSMLLRSSAPLFCHIVEGGKESRKFKGSHFGMRQALQGERRSEGGCRKDRAQ